MELVEGPDGSARAFDAGIDFGPQRHRVLGLRQLTLVGGFDATFGRNAAGVRRGPCDAHGRPSQRRCVIVAGNAKAAPGDDSENRYLNLRECHHPLTALADGAGYFVFEADREARIVDQVEKGDMEDIA